MVKTAKPSIYVQGISVGDMARPLARSPLENQVSCGSLTVASRTGGRQRSGLLYGALEKSWGDLCLRLAMSAGTRLNPFVLHELQDEDEEGEIRRVREGQMSEPWQEIFMKGRKDTLHLI